MRAGRRGGLDAPAGADAGRHGLHVLHHPGGVPGGLGDRQRGVAAALAARRAPGRASLSAAANAAGRRRWPGPRCMLANSLPYWPINPLLSTSPWYTFQIDLARSTLGRAAGGAAVGRQLSAGAGGGGLARRRSRAPGGRHLRRQHRRRHRGRPGLQHDPDSVASARKAASAC